MPLSLVATTTRIGFSTTSVVVNVPAGVVAGDLLYMIFANGDEFFTLSAPTSWTLIAELPNVAEGIRLSAYTRIATSSEPTSYTFTLSAANGLWNAAMVAVRGASVTPQPSVKIMLNSVTVQEAPKVFPSADNCMVFSVFMNAATAQPQSWTPPAGFTEIVDMGSVVSSHLEVTYKLQGTATLESPIAVLSVAASGGVAISFVVQPMELDSFIGTPIKALGSGSEVRGTSVASLSVAAPVTMYGDLMILMVSGYDPTTLPTLATPSGWILRSSTPVADATNRVWLFTRFAGFSVAATTLTFGSSPALSGAQIIAYRNVASILDDDAIAPATGSSLAFPTSTSGAQANVVVVRAGFVVTIAAENRENRISGLATRSNALSSPSQARFAVYDEVQAAAGNSVPRNLLLYDSGLVAVSANRVATANIVLNPVVQLPVGAVLLERRGQPSPSLQRASSDVIGVVQLRKVNGRSRPLRMVLANSGLVVGTRQITSVRRLELLKPVGVDITPPTIVFAVRGR